MGTESKVLFELADVANCVSGDFQTLHHNIRGAEFDILHKKVLKKYYEEASDDYDNFAELGCMFDDATAPNKNESACRIEYKSMEVSSNCTVSDAVSRTNDILETMLDNYVKMYKVFNSRTDCSKAIGIANFLQSRIEYWSKECYYFNSRRGV